MQKTFPSKIFLSVLGVTAIIPLFFHAYLGTYSRLIADDFCTAFMANQLGILRATWYWYKNWTGRYAATLLDSIVGILGPQITPFITSIVLITWLALLVWAIFHFLPASIENRLITAFALAAILLTTTLLLSPNVPQSLYWGQGMRSVIPPLMINAAGLALFRHYQLRNWRPMQQACWFALAFLVPFINGGFSETFTAAQILIIGSAIVWAWYTKIQRRHTLILFIAFIGAILAFIVVFIAPGNAIRQATYPAAPNLAELLRISLMGYSIFWSSLLNSAQKFTAILGVIGFSLLVGTQLGRNTHKAWVAPLMLMAGLMLTFACFPPAAYGTSDYPPERTQILPVYFLLITIVLSSILTGQLFSSYTINQTVKPFLTFVTLLLLLFSFLTSSNELYAARGEYIRYAQEWDQADVIIRNAHLQGKSEIIIPNSQNWTHLNVLRDNPKFWVNICYSKYYDIQVFGTPPSTQ